MTIGCLTLTVAREGGISVSLTRMCLPTDVTMTRFGGIAVNMGLVCGTNLDTGTVLWASDAKLITIDNGYLLVMDN